MSRWQRITEYVGAFWGPLSFTGLRSAFKVVGGTFFPSAPAYSDTIVNYKRTRELYSNTRSDENLGAFFARPIVDLQVDFIGLPVATIEQEDIDDFLNTTLQTHWSDEIRQMLRNVIRDSHTYVRIQQDEFDEDLLMTMRESEHCRLEVVDPERVVIERDERNDRVIKRAIVKHDIEMIEEEGDFIEGTMPRKKIHEILEIITPESYEYYDTTEREKLEGWGQENIWGFVPFVEVFNEYDSTLKGGQSDLEQVYPLIRAFHDCMTLGLQAHKYHSIPKVKLKINDVQSFLKNNFPNVLDADGKIADGATVSWKGKEILFLQSEEDAEFLEAESVLGDTKTLADFLVDCICIASSTPRWAFMDVEAGSANQANNAQTLPWAKKVMRKRKSFENTIQELLKMLMLANNIAPARAVLTWELIRPEDQATYNQALQQLVMALEVAAQRKIISDSTYREIMRQFLPTMKNPSTEEKEAQNNFDVDFIPENNGSKRVKNVPVVSGEQGNEE